MKQQKRKQQAVLKTLAAFFCLMLLFTVISRSIASLTVPEVIADHPDRGTLTVKAEGTGRILSSEEKAVTPEAGLKIRETVREGEKVKQGEALFIYDRESIEKALSQKNAELQKINLQIEQQKLQGQAEARTSPLETASRALEAAEADLQAQEEYYAQLEEAYREQSASWEENTDLNAEESEESRLAMQEYEEDNQQMLNRLNQELDKLNSLTDRYNQAVDAYEVAEIEEENLKKNEERNKELSYLQQQALEIDAVEKEKEIGKLEELFQNGGQVLSETDTVVIENPLTEGMITTGQEVLRLSHGTFVVQGSLSEEDLSKVEPKDTVILSEPGKKEEITAEISEIKGRVSGQPQEDIQAHMSDSPEIGGYFWAEIPVNEFAYGTEINYKIEKESETVYEKKIPLSAVREDGQGTYCLIIQKESTVLGEVMTAKKISVKIKERDDTYAAVDSSIGMEDQVIIGSTKSIADGDRVRIEV